MRRWLPRSLWLLAWSFWAWLGWGLARELPRNHSGPISEHGSFRVTMRILFDENDEVPLVAAPSKAFGIGIGVVATGIHLREGNFGECEQFGVAEEWIGHWGGAHELGRTFSVHCRRGMRFRMWETPIDAVAAIEGEAPPINYLLLALCQTILAIPLVLTWLALHWRRRRRLRLAGAAS